MRRIKAGNEYWTFPGGGVEKGERPDETVVREVKEETGIDVAVKELLYRFSFDDGSEQFFFRAEWRSGEPILGGEELERANSNNEYEPGWCPLTDFARLTLYPFEVRDRLAVDLVQGFASAPLELAGHLLR